MISELTFKVVCKITFEWRGLIDQGTNPEGFAAIPIPAGLFFLGRVDDQFDGGQTERATVSGVGGYWIVPARPGGRPGRANFNAPIKLGQKLDRDTLRPEWEIVVRLGSWRIGFRQWMIVWFHRVDPFFLFQRTIGASRPLRNREKPAITGQVKP